MSKPLDCEQLTTKLTELEARVDTLKAENKRLKTQLEDQNATLEATQAKTDALSKRTQTNKTRIEELQARELQKGAHLQVETVDITTIKVPNSRLEKFTTDEHTQYYRLPDQTDPLNNSQSIALAHGDLLPIQQLAKLDEDMLRSTANSLPTRLAAKLWAARADPTVGDNPWKQGSRSIKEYIKASDLKHWIRRTEQGVSDTYAKKLVSRTIDALLELTKKQSRHQKENRAQERPLVYRTENHTSSRRRNPWRNRFTFELGTEDS